MGEHDFLTIQHGRDLRLINLAEIEDVDDADAVVTFSGGDRIAVSRANLKLIQRALAARRRARFHLVPLRRRRRDAWS